LLVSTEIREGEWRYEERHPREAEDGEREVQLEYDAMDVEVGDHLDSKRKRYSRTNAAHRPTNKNIASATQMKPSTVSFILTESVRERPQSAESIYQSICRSAY